MLLLKSLCKKYGHPARKSTSSNRLQHRPEQATENHREPSPCHLPALGTSFYKNILSMNWRKQQFGPAGRCPSPRVSVGQRFCSPTGEKSSDRPAPAWRPFTRVSWGRPGGRCEEGKGSFEMKPKKGSLLTPHPTRSAALEPGSAPHAGQSGNNTRGSEGKELCTVAKN